MGCTPDALDSWNLLALLTVQHGQRHVGGDVKEHVEAKQDGDDFWDAKRQLPVAQDLIARGCRLTGEACVDCLHRQLPIALNLHQTYRRLSSCISET